METLFLDSDGTDPIRELVAEKARYYKNTKRHALSLGAEYLVLADLTLNGYRSFPAASGLPYDIVTEGPFNLMRVQVKSTLCPRHHENRHGYVFDGRRGSGPGQTGLNTYVGQADIFAFVALNIWRVRYARVGTTSNRVIFKIKDFLDDQISLSLKSTMES